MPEDTEKDVVDLSPYLGNRRRKLYTALQFSGVRKAVFAPVMPHDAFNHTEEIPQQF
jgi:hypothetical protein